MTNAEKHVAAFLAVFGAPPAWLPNSQCWVLGYTAEGNTLHAKVQLAGEALVRRWVYPNPDVWVEDPAGDIGREQIDLGEDGEELPPVTVWGREDPIAVATVELAKQLARWRPE